MKGQMNTKANLSGERVWVYGCGNFGKKIYHILKSNDVNIVGFFDIKASGGDEFDGIPVVNPKSSEVSRIFKENDLIIICIFCDQNDVEAIRADLLHSGYKRVIFYYDIELPFEKIAVNFRKDEDGDYISANKGNIENVYKLLEDDKSRRIFKKYISAYAGKNLDEFESADYEPQYFPNDIHMNKGTSRFIDCGAYDGDSIRSMVKNRGKAESIAAFEPSRNTLEKLNDYIVNTDEAPANHITIFPYAVWDKKETLAFNNNDEEKATANSLSDTGNEQIECVSIDEVLMKFKPTLIKMDVEGAEYNALLGARQTISECRPDLAICLYHALSDIWRIPLLIDSWNLNYKFYIRAYRMFGYETVLYATCEN